MSNYKTVFFILGILQIILGVSMIFPIITQFIFEELDSSFISASIITVIFGTLFLLSNFDIISLTLISAVANVPDGWFVINFLFVHFFLFIQTIARESPQERKFNEEKNNLIKYIERTAN